MLNLILAIVVSAAIDSTDLMLGDQTAMHLQLTQDADDRVEWPVFGETLQDGIEIVERSAVDTTKLSDGRVQLHQALTLTSFKDSLFVINEVGFVRGQDTFWTESLALNVVQPFELDSTNAITDIKDIEKAPINWWGIVKWILIGIGLLLLVDLLFRFWKWWEKNHQPVEAVEPEVLRPADEVALEKLDAIKEAKIWKEGKVKEYQTELTDVVREYIGRRFDVQSTEKTSDETLRELKPILLKGEGLQVTGDGKDLYAKLSKMLQLADLVKFAKWHTTPDENESALSTAYEFVHETKEVQRDNVQGTKEEEV